MVVSLWDVVAVPEVLVVIIQAANNTNDVPLVSNILKKNICRTGYELKQKKIYL